MITGGPDWKRTVTLTAFGLAGLLLWTTAATAARTVAPDVGEPPSSTGSGHLVHATTVAAPFERHWCWTGRWMVFPEPQPGIHQLRLNAAVGMGLPGRLEVGMGLPLGMTVGPMADMGRPGGGIGDLRTSLLWNLLSADHGGPAVLLGAVVRFPTGQTEKWLGEGGFSLETYAAMTLNLFGFELLVNLGYRHRPLQQVTLPGGTHFRQDDELFWGAGVQVAREEDVMLSLEATGRLGPALGIGSGWGTGPVWVGVGVDWPLPNRNRLGISMTFPAGGRSMGLMAGIRWTRRPVVDVVAMESWWRKYDLDPDAD